MLGASARRVELVAVVANPVYRSRAYLVAFDHQEGLEHVANWHYLTGSAPELRRVWNSFGVQVAYVPGGAMIAHSEIAYVIDPTGHTRYVLDTDPGPGTAATKSSFAGRPLERSAKRARIVNAPSGARSRRPGAMLRLQSSERWLSELLDSLAAAPRLARAPRLAPASSRRIATSLATSIETSAGTWAVVPMGHLDQPLNTFWQLFFRAKGATRWSDYASALAVATNGGLLVATPNGRSLVVGIRPANLLDYSPLLVTANNGRTWIPASPSARSRDVPTPLRSNPEVGRWPSRTDGMARRSLPARGGSFRTGTS